MSPARGGPKPPKIAPLRLPELSEGPVTLAAGESFDSARIAGIVLEGARLAGLTFADCELTGWEIADTGFDESAFLETRISALFAPHFSVPRGTLRQVEIDGGRIGSLDLMDARLRAVRVTDSKLGFVNLRGADLRDVTFHGCSIDGLDLGDATATRVRFEDCRVGELDLTRARLQDVDLRGLDIDRVRSVDGMRGATLGGDQAVLLAPVFAAHLGIALAD